MCNIKLQDILLLQTSPSMASRPKILADRYKNDTSQVYSW